MNTRHVWIVTWRRRDGRKFSRFDRKLDRYVMTDRTGNHFFTQAEAARVFAAHAGQEPEMREEDLTFVF